MNRGLHHGYAQSKHKREPHSGGSMHQFVPTEKTLGGFEFYSGTAKYKGEEAQPLLLVVG